MKKKSTKALLLLTSVLISSLFIQSCSKTGQHLPGFFANDQLLLSKVSGSIYGSDSNVQFETPLLNLPYTYQWTSTKFDLPYSGNFQLNFSYDSSHPGYFPIAKESFLVHGGSYNFSYNGLLPTTVLDSSWPGRDFGYWQFYFNNRKEVEKVGLAFSVASQPTRYEFYSRDILGQISSFIYGPSVDTPFMKVIYQYDDLGNISNFNIYTLKNSTPGYDPLSIGKIGAKFSDTRQKNLQNAVSPNAGEVNKENQTHSLKSIPPNAADTTIYDLYVTAAVTTDGKRNPFSQQDNIFFYQTNRWTLAFNDPTTFFLSLLRSNPVKIDYEVVYWNTYYPQYFPDVSVTQEFNYTYNRQGYPVTIHENFIDPNEIIMGSYNRDSQLTYLQNK